MVNSERIQHMYKAFNERDIDTVLSFMHPQVRWPNGWEGGYVHGRDQVREYWSRQWKEINPTVHPIKIEEGSDQRSIVTVHQRVEDLDGRMMMDGYLKHVYTFENNLVTEMRIEPGN